MMDLHESSGTLGGVFKIGGDLPVNRFGYGTMRLVGDGAWGERMLMGLRLLND